MKKLTIAVASLLALPCIHASGKGPLKTSKDSASYALGVNVGLSLKQQLSTLPGGSVDMDIFTEALNSSIKTNDTSKLAITPSKTPAIINMYMQRAQEEQNAKDKAANDIWLANNAKKAGVKTTASGLQYQVLKL